MQRLNEYFRMVSSVFLIACATIAFLSPTNDARAAAKPRDALSGLWRQVPSLDKNIRNDTIAELCAEKFYNDLTESKDEFLLMMPFHNHFLRDSQVFISNYYMDIGAQGVVEIREQRVTGHSIRKFLIRRTGIFLYLYSGVDTGRASAHLRISSRSTGDRYFVKCEQ